MVDTQDILDVIDVIFEYGSPMIEDIAIELVFSESKIYSIIDFLVLHNIVSFENGFVTPLIEYEKAVLLIQSM